MILEQLVAFSYNTATKLGAILFSGLKKVRGEERDMTTHLIKVHIFAHASRVTKFSASLVSRRREI